MAPPKSPDLPIFPGPTSRARVRAQMCAHARTYSTSIPVVLSPPPPLSPSPKKKCTRLPPPLSSPRSLQRKEGTVLEKPEERARGCERGGGEDGGEGRRERGEGGLLGARVSTPRFPGRVRAAPVSTGRGEGGVGGCNDHGCSGVGGGSPSGCCSRVESPTRGRGSSLGHRYSGMSILFTWSGTRRCARH